MTDSSPMDELLAADARDSGCDTAFALLDVFVEEELTGSDPGLRYPGVAAHLRACPACREDYVGLVAAAAEPGDQGPGPAA